MKPMKTFIRMLLPLVLASGLSHAAPETKPGFVGQWSGEAHTDTERTRLILNIHSDNGNLRADMTLVDIGVMGWPAKSVKANKGLTLTFPSDSGDQIMRFSLDATEADGQQLTGTWSDNRFGQPAQLTLRRITDAATVTETAVQIDGPAGQLSAAIILPAGRGPHPGVVFLHGAGPQPKDASRFAARELAKRGIVALIFDKRGIAGSTGELAGASFSDLADDGVAAAKYLLSLPEVSTVGFFGHSQGGWIGPLAATKWEKSAFVISSAGPAVPPSREAHWEFVRNLHELDASESDIEIARQAIDDWHEGVRSGNWSRFDAALETIRSKFWFKPAGLNHLPREPDAGFADSYRAYMDYDPMPTLKTLRVPMLSIFAPLDESIDALETEQILRGLIEQGSDIQIKLYPGYDHSMRNIGKDGQALRWPQHPEDYFSGQAEFVHNVVSGR
jgi:dienelactone hydrolase